MRTTRGFAFRRGTDIKTTCGFDLRRGTDIRTTRGFAFRRGTDMRTTRVFAFRRSKYEEVYLEPIAILIRGYPNSSSYS